MSIGHEKSKFWVVTMISNPVRYASRYKLYNKFKQEMAEAGVNLFTVEVQHGNRDFAVTRAGDPNCLQLRTNSELWHKENALNLGIQRIAQIAPDFKYLSWIDADISFQRNDFIEETLHQLQHYKFVQMFQSAIDLGPSGEVLQTHHGFMWGYLNGKPVGKAYGSPGHPGYAWACTREALDAVGSLLSTPILGASDHHMAMALINRAEQSYPAGVSPGYKEDVLTWQSLCERHIHRDVGYVPGTILHHFHGSKRKRFYVERWDVLIKHQYDPNTDICTDVQGLYRLVGNKPKLRDAIRLYMRSRDEDSTSAD